MLADEKRENKVVIVVVAVAVAAVAMLVAVVACVACERVAVATVVVAVALPVPLQVATVQGRTRLPQGKNGRINQLVAAKYRYIIILSPMPKLLPNYYTTLRPRWQVLW